MAKFEINGKPDKRKHASVLADRQKAITARQSELCEEARDNEGSRFTDEASKEFNTLQEEFDACTASLEALGAKKLSGGWAMPTVAGPGAGRALGLDDDAPAQTRQQGSTTGGRLYADLFGQPRQCAVYGSTGEFLLDISRNNQDRLMAATGSSEGIPADGGHLVPEQFFATISDGAMESEIVRKFATLLPMDMPVLNYSAPDNSDHSGNAVYGMSAAWVPEGGQITYEIAKTRRMRLEARKLVMMTASTNEMLYDVSTFGGMLETQLQEAISWNMDRTFLIDGTGSGQPRSILNDPALVTVSKESGQAAVTLYWENIVKMAARLHPSCAAKAIWIANQTCMPALMSMSVSVGTGGTWAPAITSIGGQYQMLGRPIYFTEKCNTIGTAGDIILADLSKYHVGVMRNGLRIDRSMHVLFSTDETVFRIVMRADGQGSWSQAFVPKHGDSLSWCVALQTRA